MAGTNVVELTDSTFAEGIASGVVLVDFWAPWCGPCRSLGPVIDELADDLAGEAVVAKLNVDENQQTAASHMIRSIPALLLFKDGKLQEQFVGMQPKDKLSAAIKNLL